MSKDSDSQAYRIRESTRARRIGITVYPDGQVVVTKPLRSSYAAAERFAIAQREWIEQQRTRYRSQPQRQRSAIDALIPRLRRGTKAYEAAREQARALVTERLLHFNAFYALPYTRISIRNQKTRWGSCSVRGHLSFNYNIVFLPSHLADYVVVHELCHVREHNHSPRFWALVAQTFPNHRALRKELRG